MSFTATPVVRLRDIERQACIDLIEGAFEAVLEAVHEAATRLQPIIGEAADLVGACLARGGKLLVCGNGGSAATAQHFAGEMVGRFRDVKRPGLRALALNADSAVLTGWSSDAGYEDVFARQVETFGQAGDVLVCISTSGNSPNLLRACRAARRVGLKSIALLGPGDSGLAQAADIAINTRADDAQRTQEVHLFILHVISELIENSM